MSSPKEALRVRSSCQAARLRCAVSWPQRCDGQGDEGEQARGDVDEKECHEHAGRAAGEGGQQRQHLPHAVVEGFGRLQGQRQRVLGIRLPPR